MDIVPSDWSGRHKKLNQIIRNAKYFTPALEMILNLHQDLHALCVSGMDGKNQIDALWNDMDQKEYAVMPTSKDETIAWAIWHIVRIEDLTMNILVNNGSQIFDESWKQRMNISVSDTGCHFKNFAWGRSDRAGRFQLAVGFLGEKRCCRHYINATDQASDVTFK